MAGTAKALNARFLISVGNRFYDYRVMSVTDPAWRKFFVEIHVRPQSTQFISASARLYLVDTPCAI